MKIVPIELNFQTLYENRHLLTDDFQFNSLIVSNIFNTNINLIDIVSFNNLDDNIKMKSFKDYNYNTRSYYKILSQHNIYVIYEHEPENYGYWDWEEYNYNKSIISSNTIDVLVLL